MKKYLAAASLIALSGIGITGVSFAHGGTYRGPGDTVPPGGGGGGGGGGGPTGPGSPGGPNGPDGAGGDPGGAITGVPGRTGSGPNSNGGRSTTGNIGDFALDLTQWSFWWEFNKDGYLNLKNAIHSTAPMTGDTGFFVGDGKRNRATDNLRPSQKRIRDKVVPALLSALDRETNNDIVTGCLIALAKIGDQRLENGTSPFAQTFAKFLNDGNQEIAETAALALGILASDASVPLLTDLLTDSKAGRRAVGKNEVDLRSRAFAAYGLSLIGNQSASEEVRQGIVKTLTEVIDSTQSSTRDIKVACLVGLGLVQLSTLDSPAVEPGAQAPPYSSRMAQIEYLRAFFKDERAEDIERAHCPAALTRLYGGLPDDRKEAVKSQLAADFLACIGKRTAANYKSAIQQSAVLALGQLGDCDSDPIDEEIRSSLSTVSKPVKDQQVRFFAQIALGQIGARSGREGDSEAGRLEVGAALSSALSKGNAAARWAGLGIGVMGRGLTDSGADWMPEELVLALRAELKRAKAPDDVSAFSVAAGMLGDPEMSKLLRDKLDRTALDTPRGYAALGLGLMDAGEAVLEIQDVVKDSKYRPELLKQAAIALGLLGDKDTVPVLIAMLRDSKSLASQASISAALGFIGDRRSIDPLIEMLNNQSLTGSARGFAAVALGIVADKEPFPWNHKIAKDINYRASTVTLNSADAGTGVLNIL